MSDEPIRIPADIDRDDRILWKLTGRQLSWFALAAVLLYSLWSATKAFLPLPAFAIIALPLIAGTVALVLGRRDGVSLDRLLLAALRHQLAPRRRVAAPDGIHPLPGWANARTISDAQPVAGGQSSAGAVPLRLPAEGVGETGVIDLGGDGMALVAACGTVNFALRTPREQAALVTAFGRWLHSLSGEVQILVRAERLDLSPQINQLYETAGGLPHPALEEAAAEHAAFLAQLAENTTLLRRNVLLIFREPTHPLTDLATGGLLSKLLPDRRGRTADRDDAASTAAQQRLTRRLSEAVDLLAAVGITVTPLDAGQATAVLAAACNPEQMAPAPGMAAAGEVITTTPTDDDSTTPPHPDPIPTPRPAHPSHDRDDDEPGGFADGAQAGDDERVRAFLRRYTP